MNPGECNCEGCGWVAVGKLHPSSASPSLYFKGRTWCLIHVSAPVAHPRCLAGCPQPPLHAAQGPADGTQRCALQLSADMHAKAYPNPCYPCIQALALFHHKAPPSIHALIHTARPHVCAAAGAPTSRPTLVLNLAWLLWFRPHVQHVTQEAPNPTLSNLIACCCRLGAGPGGPRHAAVVIHFLSLDNLVLLQARCWTWRTMPCGCSNPLSFT